MVRNTALVVGRPEGAGAFDLQEQIKAPYKLSVDIDHLERAIQPCEQSLAFAPLAFEALKGTWERDCPG